MSLGWWGREVTAGGASRWRERRRWGWARGPSMIAEDRYGYTKLWSDRGMYPWEQVIKVE